MDNSLKSCKDVSPVNTKAKYNIVFLKWLNLILFVTLVNCLPAKGQVNNNWPSFHGSDRQNKSAETGLLNTWPAAGPEKLWEASGIGEGYSSVIVADGLIYTAGKSEKQTYVNAFDMNGKLIWKKPNGASWDVEVSWASSYSGSRSTPTYDNGVVYHLSEAGLLSAFKAKTGDLIWSRNLVKDFSAKIPMYGYSESVLIDGNNLYVKPGGQKGYQVCMNKMTGATIWANSEIPGDYGYNSAVLKDFGGYHQIINASSGFFYGIDTGTGKLLWKVGFENSYKVNCTDVATFNDYVLMSTGEGGGCLVVKLKSSGNSITTEKVWQNNLMDNYYGGVLLHDGYIYGTGNSSRSWYCLDALTGKQMWKTPGSGSLTFADGMLYLYDEKGTIKLIKTSPEKFEKTGEFKVPNGGAGPYWAHPVVSGGRMYLRHADKLFVYKVK
jgi:outer membrane protein assembly factor BamB